MRRTVRAAAWTWGALTALAGVGPSDANGGKDSAPALPVVAGELGAKIREALSAAMPSDAWGLVLVAQKGTLVFAAAYGAADYASAPIGLTTLFELASASKQVTATAILRLEQQGRLKTTDPLSKVFAGVPKDKANVTIGHLLHHTAGLSPDLGVPYASTIGREAYVRQMLEPPLASEPGTKFAYSNAGYALLAAVVEQVTGKGFEDYVRRELFAPAGMTDSGFVNEDRLIRLDRATTRKGTEPGAFTAARWHYGWGYRGMGGVVTTGQDLLAWDRALRGEKLLGAAAKAKLHAPALEGYACGWKIETTDRGTVRAHHSGSVMGYRCQLDRWLEDDTFLAVLTNGEGDPFLAERAILPLLFPPPRLEADLDAGPNEPNENGAVVATEGVTLEVSRATPGAALVVRTGRHALATLRLTRGHVEKLAADLGQALAGREAESSPAATEAGLYLGPYGGEKVLHLSEGLMLEVRPRYEGRGADGQPVVDDRPLLVLVDGRRGAWPLMVKMNAAAARGFAKALQALLGPAGPGPR